MKQAVMRLRSRINNRIRCFFDRRGYLEVETPLLAPHLIPESHLEVFATELITPYGPSQPRYLIPSPEVWHKQLLAAGYGNLFEITRCFRNGEQFGAHHNPEFTMLEYYTVDADHLDSITVTEHLFDYLLDELQPELLDYGRSEAQLQQLRPPFARLSVRAAVLSATGIDINDHQRSGSLAAAAERIGMAAPASRAEGTHGLEGGGSAGAGNDAVDSWEGIFNRIFVDRVEPELPQERPLVLTDYPAQIRTLAQSTPDQRSSRRWELYAGGIELANCYAEERSAETVAQFFAAEAVARRHCRVPHAVDQHFSRWFGEHFPRCSGVALGVDRLVMLLLGEINMSRVILFPESDILPQRTYGNQGHTQGYTR
ncbi:MAG: hypothetical protein EA384_01390 [Spirochaetaceae bacterium]|nr:MAG: hypothetical protein EA384_01390 [Spirochaetaceae bacterium]